ncbi:hypothetical protein D3C84_1111420 [compost metagenome]
MKHLGLVMTTSTAHADWVQVDLLVGRLCAKRLQFSRLVMSVGNAHGDSVQAGQRNNSAEEVANLDHEAVS